MNTDKEGESDVVAEWWKWSRCDHSIGVQPMVHWSRASQYRVRLNGARLAAARRVPPLVGFAALLAALFVTGCSTFNYEWRRVVRVGTATNDVVGAWEGKWVSNLNGHNGKLRCLITRETNGVLNARFYATYKRILRFGYTVPLEARGTDNGVAFLGSADLGKLAGGVYKYSGYATPTNFFSTYESKYDHGTFEMLRPGDK
jgi:hypothetical protein